MNADAPDEDVPDEDDARNADAMNTDNRNPDETSDREWRAFRYVSGEMAADEIDDFERLLADDQSARELVAHSTQLLLGAWDALDSEAASEDSRNGSPESRPRRVASELSRPITVRPATLGPAARPGGWAVAGLAAAVCVLIGIGLSLLPQGESGSLKDASADAADGGAVHLVAIWSQRLAELAPESAATESAVSDRPEAPLPGETDGVRAATPRENPPFDSAAAADQIAADESDVPGWMIAALELGPGYGR